MNEGKTNILCPCGSGKNYMSCCFGSRYIGLHRPSFSFEKYIGNTKLKAVPHIIWNGYRCRLIWDKVYLRPLEETFHEFLITLLFITLSKGWINKQRRLQIDKQHALIKWIDSYFEWRNRIRLTIIKLSIAIFGEHNQLEMSNAFLHSHMISFAYN